MFSKHQSKAEFMNLGDFEVLSATSWTSICLSVKANSYCPDQFEIPCKLSLFIDSKKTSPGSSGKGGLMEQTPDRDGQSFGTFSAESFSLIALLADLACNLTTSFDLSKTTLFD